MDTLYEETTTHVDEAHALGYEWCDMHQGYVDPEETYVHVDIAPDGEVILSVCEVCEDGHGYRDYLDDGGIPGIVIMDELDPYEHDTAWY